MQRFFNLETTTWAASSTRVVNLDPLPAGQRVRKLILTCELSGTKGETDTLDGRLFAQAISLLKVGNFVNIPGWHLQELNSQIYGKWIMDPTDIPGSGTTFNMIFVLEIPFRDPRQPGVDDGSIPSELLMSKGLEISFAAAAVWGVDDITLTAGTVRAEAEMVQESSVPQLQRIGYQDPGSLSYSVEPGVYKDLFVCDDVTPGTITTAEIATLDCELDGNSVWNNATHFQIVAAYNFDGVRDAAGEVVKNAATRLPIIWHDVVSGKANISKQPAVLKQGNVQLTGTITAPRYVYWKAVEKDEQALVRIGEATGAPRDSKSYTPATASKTQPLARSRSQALGRFSKKDRLLSNVLSGKFRE